MNVVLHVDLPLALDTSAFVLLAGVVAVAVVCYDVWRREVFG